MNGNHTVYENSLTFLAAILPALTRGRGDRFSVAMLDALGGLRSIGRLR
jgi:hypothetical protein